MNPLIEKFVKNYHSPERVWGEVRAAAATPQAAEQAITMLVKCSRLEAQSAEFQESFNQVLKGETV